MDSKQEPVHDSSELAKSLLVIMFNTVWRSLGGRTALVCKDLLLTPQFKGHQHAIKHIGLSSWLLVMRNRSSVVIHPRYLRYHRLGRFLEKIQWSMQATKVRVSGPCPDQDFFENGLRHRDYQESSSDLPSEA
jgi:hypothetical protein